MLAARRADGRDRAATSTTSSACRSPCCAPTAETRFLVLEMGARGVGHIASPVRDRPAAGRRRCSTSAPPTSASSAPARRSRRPRARSSRRCPPTASAVLNADDPLVAAMAARTAARVLTFGTRPATSRWRGRGGSTTSAGRPSTLGYDGDVARRSTLAQVGAHQVANAAAAAAMALAAGRRRRRRRRRPRRARGPPSPLADGAPRARRRRGRGQRRLQRQPGLDGRRARRPGRDRPRRGGRRTVAVLGEMLELGRRPPRRRTTRRRATPPRSASTSLVAVGEAAEAIARRRRRATGWPGQAVPTAGRDEALDWLRRECRGRGRRAGQGVAGRRARARGRRLLADGADRGRKGARPMRAILLGGGLALLITLLGTRRRDPLLHPAGLRPGDPRRRPDQPPHQARHADHGRRW